ncbi:MAG: hypothetical protein Fur0032_11740 [Terrimicrobiaceae bacterium]
MNRLLLIPLLVMSLTAVTAQGIFDDARIKEKILERRAFSSSEIQQIDQNSDGVIDVRDLTLFYQNNPDAKPFALFEESGSTVIADGRTAEVSVLFSSAFSGTLRYQISGPGVVGLDYELMDGQVWDEQSATVRGSQQVSGSSAVIRIKTRKIEEFSAIRPIVITLTTGAVGQPPRYFVSRMSPDTRSNPSVHTLNVTPGDKGVYGAVLSFPPGSNIEPQTLNIALRSNGKAVFDVSRSTLFDNNFEVNIGFGEGSQFSWSGTASGTSEKTVSPPGAQNKDIRHLAWSLQFGANTYSGANEVVVPVSISLSGLTASARAENFPEATLTLQKIR